MQCGNKVFKHFEKEFVELITTLSISVSHMGVDGSGNEKSTPLALKGYLLDEDEFYYYIGDTENVVTQAVSKDIIASIEIPKFVDKYDRLLEEFDHNDSSDN